MHPGETCQGILYWCPSFESRQDASKWPHLYLLRMIQDLVLDRTAYRNAVHQVRSKDLKHCQDSNAISDIAYEYFGNVFAVRVNGTFQAAGLFTVVRQLSL